MRTPEHILDASGDCRRCGLDRRFGTFCPPGFWMTVSERRAWDAANDDGRSVVEARALAVRGRAAEPHKGDDK